MPSPTLPAPAAPPFPLSPSVRLSFMELSARLQGRLMVPRNGTIRIQSFTAQYKSAAAG